MAELFFRTEVDNTQDGTPIYIVRTFGAIDTSTVRDFEDQLVEIYEERKIHVVLMLSELRYINSTGMGLLIKFNDIFQQAGGFLKLVDPPEQVVAFLVMLNLKHLIFKMDEIYSSTNSDVVENEFDDFDSPPPPPPPPAIINWPCATQCANCHNPIEFPQAGQYQCQRCFSFVEIDNTGRQRVKMRIDSHIIEMFFPASEHYIYSTCYAINALVAQVGFSQAFCAEINEALNHAISIIAENSQGAHENFQMFAIADEQEMIIGLRSLHGFMTASNQVHPKLRVIASRVNKLEVFPLSSGQLLKMHKLRK